MAKKPDRKNAREKRMEELAVAYSSARARVNFSDETDAQQQAKVFIREGVKILVKITDESNAVIEDDYNQIANVLGLPLSKSQYKECVDVMSKIKAGEYSDRNRERYAEQVEQKRYDGMLRESFLENVIDDGKEMFPMPTTNSDKIGNVVRENIKAEDDKEFGEIFSKSVERIMNIRDILQAEFNIFADAFSYITSDRYSRKDFKRLVEWEYFEAGVPSETSAPKLWSDIYRAWDTIRLARAFRSEDFGDYTRELGLECELYEPEPNEDHRSWWKRQHWDLFSNKDDNE